MARWIEKIELNAAIDANKEEFDLSRVEEPLPTKAKDRLCAELRKSQWLAGFVPDIKKAKCIAEVDRILQRVYDTADRVGVWCGMF